VTETIENIDKILYFSAEWCGYCTSLYQDIKTVLEDKNVAIVTVDVDLDESLADKWAVRMIPTIITLDQNDAILETVIGEPAGRKWLAQTGLYSP
jgi:thioredoxin-like negative regulator of GroEL